MNHQFERMNRLFGLQQKIADRTSRAYIEYYCNHPESESDDSVFWYSLVLYYPGTAQYIADSAEYLTLRGLLKRHPEHADWVRVDVDKEAALQELADQAQALDMGYGFDFKAHLQRQRDFSEKTFGPGARTAGVVDHIRKELREIEAAPADITEWIDVVILALDGAWRSGASPQEIIDAMVAKQTKNEGRAWPDWRTMPTDKAIEHERSDEEPAAQTIAEGATADFKAEREADKLDVMRIDHICQKGVRGSTYKTVTSVNVIVDAETLVTRGVRAAIDKQIERDAAIAQQKARSHE